MNRAEKALLHLSTVLLAVSGLSFATMKYLMKTSDPFAVIHHPLQPYALYLHIWAAPVSLFVMGLIAKDHIFGESRRPAPRFRRTGLLSIGSWTLSTISGYLLPTATGEGYRSILVVAHLTTGGLFLLVYLFHLVLAVRFQQAQRRARQLVSVSAAGYNSSEPNSGREQPPSVEGLA